MSALNGPVVCHCIALEIDLPIARLRERDVQCIRQQLPSLLRGWDYVLVVVSTVLEPDALQRIYRAGRKLAAEYVQDPDATIRDILYEVFDLACSVNEALDLDHVRYTAPASGATYSFCPRLDRFVAVRPLSLATLATVQQQASWAGRGASEAVAECAIEGFAAHVRDMDTFAYDTVVTALAEHAYASLMLQRDKR